MKVYVSFILIVIYIVSFGASQEDEDPEARGVCREDEEGTGYNKGNDCSFYYLCQGEYVEKVPCPPHSKFSKTDGYCVGGVKPDSDKSCDGSGSAGAPPSGTDPPPTDEPAPPEE